MSQLRNVKSNDMIISGAKWDGYKPGSEPFIAVNASTHGDTRQFVAISAIHRDYAHIFMSKQDAIALATNIMLAALEIDDEHAEWKV